MIHSKYNELRLQQEELITRPNEVKTTFYNGIYERYIYPVLTRHHVPLHWRFDLDAQTNPFFMERLGVNAALNPGAIYHEGKYILVSRTEGLDRKSFFALAESDNGIDQFRFIDAPLVWEDIDPEETNMYDMRLVKHEDGWIYGIYCSEKRTLTHHPTIPPVLSLRPDWSALVIFVHGPGFPTSLPSPHNNATLSCTLNLWTVNMPSILVPRTGLFPPVQAEASPSACAKILHNP